MIKEPAPNLTARPYRGLSVQAVDVSLDQATLTEHLLGREVYRRTEFLLLEQAGDSDAYALVQVEKESYEPLFSPIVGIRLLAGPDETVMIHSPGTDVGNASALARVAAEHHKPHLLAYAVRGLFEHINFIYQPQPVIVDVTEVVPPRPPKLLAMAQQVLDFDEDLPPVILRSAEVDLGELSNSADSVLLLPCRGSGFSSVSEVEFLDTRPLRRDWVMVGCERSEQFHEHFYGDIPERVDICPRRRDDLDRPGSLTLTKCCLLERGVISGPGHAVVPWGSNLDEVRLALRTLLGLDAPTVPTIRSETSAEPADPVARLTPVSF